MVSQNGIDIIKRFEGFRDKAYLCPAGKWTIGYGSTFWEDGKKVEEGQVITRERAAKLMEYWANSMTVAAIGILPETTKRILTQNQIDVIASFVYNVGVAKWTSSTLCKMIGINPNNKLIGIELKKWKYGGGKVQKGLINRREAELQLYYK